MPCAEGAQAHRCRSGHLGIPEKLAAWKSLTEDVLEFGGEVLSTSRLSKLSSAEDDVSLKFMEK